MSDINLITQINRGFVAYADSPHLTAFPALNTGTPGIAAYPLYNLYAPLHGARSTIGNPFCSEKKRDLADGTGGIGLAVNGQTIESTKPQISEKDQVGRGKISLKRSPSPPSFSLSDDKVKNVIDRMAQSAAAVVYNVEKFDSSGDKKRKLEQKEFEEKDPKKNTDIKESVPENIIEKSEEDKAAVKKTKREKNFKFY
jgi:hypothetical protein